MRGSASLVFNTATDFFERITRPHIRKSSACFTHEIKQKSHLHLPQNHFLYSKFPHHPTPLLLYMLRNIVLCIKYQTYKLFLLVSGQTCHLFFVCLHLLLIVLEITHCKPGSGHTAESRQSTVSEHTDVQECTQAHATHTQKTCWNVLNITYTHSEVSLSC